MEKQGARDSLIKDIEAELAKGAEDIDGDVIDRKLDELYALEGRSPPKLSGEALDAATRTVRSRAAWRRRNTLVEGARRRRAVRGAWAACFAALFLVSANQVTTLVTGSCLPSKVGIKICCGTKFCLCETAQGEEEAPSHE
jgi:hypothetical protein